MLCFKVATWVKTWNNTVGLAINSLRKEEAAVVEENGLDKNDQSNKKLEKLGRLCKKATTSPLGLALFIAAGLASGGGAAASSVCLWRSFSKEERALLLKALKDFGCMRYKKMLAKIAKVRGSVKEEKRTGKVIASACGTGICSAVALGIVALYTGAFVVGKG